MIVCCEKCQTRFKLNEHRIKPPGVRLRCSKCQHTFELKLPAACEVPSAENKSASLVSPSDPAPPTDALLSDFSEADRVEEAAQDALLGVDEVEEAEEDPAEDLFGPHSALDSPALDPDQVGEPIAPSTRERSEDFDWDHLSFTEEKISTDDKAAAGKNDPASLKRPHELPLELATDRGVIKAGKDFHPPVQGAANAPRPSSRDSLELDSTPARKAEHRASDLDEPPRRRESKPSFERVEHETPTKSERGTAPVLGALPFGRTNDHVPGPVLVLPKIPSLVGACILGIAVAASSALTLYAPAMRGCTEVRVVGGMHPATDLSVGDLRTRTLDREKGGTLYVVTGSARWLGPAGGAFTLEGVLVDSKNRSLQRRFARVGPIPSDAEIRATNPWRFAPRKVLPGAGEVPFTIVFNPDPTWRAEVRFQVRAGG
ncbi:MAG: hypothetical protein A2Y95_07645 [Deltaproteobacteria bacterium RBG_13_65_10]|nr:MAG: hypothetical protein A2Y95_07645 [Deltaproteobacteria bacterium RBG_13_65_10]